MKLVPTDSTTDALLSGLERIGYAAADGLLARNYTFPDWFSNQELRTLDAAAFGRTPVSYESSCIGVARANGCRELPLVNSFRAFAAPVLLEVDRLEVREWAVSFLPDKHALVGRYPLENLDSIIAKRAHDWAPEALLRAKNIASPTTGQQRDLFAGLLPELEEQIQEKLDPLVRDTLERTRRAYLESTGRHPSPRALFKLAFWTLTAKVFRDRHVSGFASLDADPAAIHAAVAKHYRVTDPPPLNREARAAAAASVWSDLDFRNLSVEALAHIWSRTLVDPQTRKELGIHRTPRSIVRYLVDRLLPAAASGGDARIVFEPCSGSAAFLIGALNHLRPRLTMTSPQERHRFFVGHLAGMEKDPFGAEISRLALTLADFPNPNGWDITEADVFKPSAMEPWLRRASVVLCNPPFERFLQEDRRKYQSTFARKPAELLHRVLADIHPRGVIGFVLPYIAVDGREYAKTRELIASRFASVEMAVLPEMSFDDAQTDVVLLIAKEPIPHLTTKFTFRKVDDSPLAWAAFQRDHSVSFEDSADVIASAAAESLCLPELPDVWRYLSGSCTLGDFAKIHIGVQWHPPYRPAFHVRDRAASGYLLGVPPNAKIFAFQRPELKYLNVEPRNLRRNALQFDWAKPKVIVPKARQSRRHWRIAAFADREGIICNQAFQGVWSNGEFDEVVLAAILNGPLANAFIATHEGNRDVTGEVLKAIPMPRLTQAQQEKLHALVERYEACVGTLAMQREEDPEKLLKDIDALVLDGYCLPPKLERALLDYCSDGSRPVAHAFSPYFPPEFDVYVSLSQYRSARFQNARVDRMIRTFGAR